MIYQGAPVSKGVVIGQAFVYEPFKPEITEHIISAGEVAANVERYESVIEEAGIELAALRDKMAELDPDKAGIFQAHHDILNDMAIRDEITGLIKNDCYSPEFAVETVYEKFIGILSSMDDDIIRERCADLKDVKTRVLRIWLGVTSKDLSDIETPAVVFARDLLPSDTATLDRGKVLAIVTEIGGNTSHSAIIARSYEIPALLGVGGIMNEITDGVQVIVDALEGRLIIEPAPEDVDKFSRKQKEFAEYAENLKRYQRVEPVTKEGERINICLNIGSVNDDELEGASFTDGVGLFRSEFLFMAGKELPSENQQFEVYKKAAKTFGERQVILRTLDIGGDKTLECMDLPVEDNPFLGCRALRLCFQKTELFCTQLRAALRASAFGNLAIMFPMVGSIEDLRKAKDCLEEAKAELRQEDIPFNENISVGIMIEIPAIALMAEQVAQEVDFASIGTNDLCQYLMAVDRLNPDVAIYYQSYHPAMFKIISYVSKAFTKAGKPLSICGEMGGDPMAAMAFLGMGIKKLSMVASSVAGVKRMVTKIDLETAKRMANEVIGMYTAKEIEEYLGKELQNISE